MVTQRLEASSTPALPQHRSVSSNYFYTVATSKMANKDTDVKLPTVLIDNDFVNFNGVDGDYCDLPLPKKLKPSVSTLVAKTTRVLYVFAGKQRKCDVAHFLHLSLKDELTIKEVDICRDGTDVLDEASWQSMIDSISAGAWDVLIITPPCSTWSRVRWANKMGPPPVRSRQWVWGFPWLEGRWKKDCDNGNCFIRKTLEASALAHSVGCKFFIEHPEDLGTTAAGFPASIWILPELLELAHNWGLDSSFLPMRSI